MLCRGVSSGGRDDGEEMRGPVEYLAWKSGSSIRYTFESSSRAGATRSRVTVGGSHTLAEQLTGARVLHLIYRLVVQPNTSRAQTFAHSFISFGGIETLLVLLQREAKTGDHNVLANSALGDVDNVSKESSAVESTGVETRSLDDQSESPEQKESVSHDEGSQAVSPHSDYSPVKGSLETVGRMTSASESQFLKNLGGISFSISAHSARNNVYNIDNGDGVVVGIISLLGALVTSGHLKIGSSAAPSSPPSNFLSSLAERW